MAARAEQAGIEHLGFARITRPGAVSKIARQDVRGFRHSISNQAVKHSRSGHSNLDPADFGRLPRVVKSTPTLSKDRGVNGVPRLQYDVEIDGAQYRYIAEVRRRAKRLDAITFFKL